jgi:hypothetical protein
LRIGQAAVPPGPGLPDAAQRRTIVKRVIVRYKVKSDRAVENERLVRAVYEQLARERPARLRYATFKLDDGVSFVHIASHESDGGPSPLTELSAFKAFIAEIGDRCEEQPVAVELHEIGSYAVFDS